MGMGCDFHLVCIAVARSIAPFPCLCRAFHVLNRVSHVHDTVVSLPDKATAVCFFLLIRPRQVLVGGFDFATRRVMLRLDQVVGRGQTFRKEAVLIGWC